MSVLSRTDFKNKVDLYFTPGTPESCTLTEVVELLKDAADSLFNLTDDSALLLSFADYNPARNYAIGEGCFYNSLPRRANQATTGAFTEAHWDVVWPLAQGGVVKYDLTQLSYAGAGAEELLSTLNVPANTFLVRGQVMRIVIAGTYAGNPENKSLKVNVGATVIYNETVATVGGNYRVVIDLHIIEDGSKVKAVYADQAGVVQYTLINPLNLINASDVHLYCTSLNNGNVVNEVFYVEKIGILS